MAHSRNKLLKPSQAIHALHPEVSRNEIIHALRERVKELTALHATVCMLQDENLSVKNALGRIVRLIPPAWQHPDITVARIIVGDCDTRTVGFRRTRWLQACDFSINPSLTGRIEVYYLKKMPLEAEGPFLAEERNLINSLADILRTYFERKLAAKALTDAHNDLERRVRERTRELEKLNSALKVEVTERELRQKEVLSYQKKLRTLSSELILTEERERRAIATDLHDIIGQNLAMAKIKAGTLRKFCSSQEAAGELQNLSGFINEAILSTRNLTFQLVSPILYELGLESALERLAQDISKSQGLKVDFRAEGRRMQLPIEISVFIFKAVRELLLNSVKHSGTPDVKIRVRRSNNRINITVRDTGCGFNVDEVSVYYGNKRAFGLFSIREKVSYLGGSFRLNSRPGQGTLAVITVPLSAAATKPQNNR